jgi:hypothetical protein
MRPIRLVANLTAVLALIGSTQAAGHEDLYAYDSDPQCASGEERAICASPAEATEGAFAELSMMCRDEPAETRTQRCKTSADCAGRDYSCFMGYCWWYPH